jgi:hypothetical protein
MTHPFHHNRVLLLYNSKCALLVVCWMCDRTLAAYYGVVLIIMAFTLKQPLYRGKTNVLTLRSIHHKHRQARKRMFSISCRP